ncbi:MAG TPA: XdhC/CoxI family protein [Vicinamibacterales bacterium]|jgi:xanthine dehydrogenase accessory factor
MAMDPDIFRIAADVVGRGERAALVTIVGTSGSTPQRVGAKMIVFEDGHTVGTIGGGCYENDAAGKAREAIRAHRPQLVRYDLNDELAAESGLICGGQMEVFIEPLEAAPHLFLIGAGHVSAEVARAAHHVGFRVHVIDDRDKFANPERFPDAEIVVDDIPEWLARTEFPPGSYFVVVTRGHRGDHQAVRALAGQEWRYLGLIGSRAKVLRIFDALRGEGVPAARLADIHAPIGLDIGAVTPAEIALSITAELVAVRSGRIAEPHVAAVALRSRLPSGAANS